MRSGSHVRSLPRFQRLVAPGMRCASLCHCAHSFHGWASRASVRYGSKKWVSLARSSRLNDDATPTLWSLPAPSWRPSSIDPTSSPGASLYQRKPATTQSAVRACLIFIIARLPGRYARSFGFAITPSRPAPSKRSNQSCATAGSLVIGVRWTGAFESPSASSRSFRRSCCGRPRRSSSPSASRSHATNDDGASFASIATREAAGWMRRSSAPKSRTPPVAITISPSSTQRSGSASRSGPSSSGK